MRPFGVELVCEGVEPGLWLEGCSWPERASGFFFQGEMHSLMAAVLARGCPGLMRSIDMPSLNHQTESLERLNSPFGLANGTPLSDRIACGKPGSKNSCSKAVRVGFSRVDSRASQRGRKPDA